MVGILKQQLITPNTMQLKEMTNGDQQQNNTSPSPPHLTSDTYSQFLFACKLKINCFYSTLVLRVFPLLDLLFGGHLHRCCCCCPYLLSGVHSFGITYCCWNAVNIIKGCTTVRWCTPAMLMSRNGRRQVCRRAVHNSIRRLPYLAYCAAFKAFQRFRRINNIAINTRPLQNRSNRAHAMRGKGAKCKCSERWLRLIFSALSRLPKISHPFISPAFA